MFAFLANNELVPLKTASNSSHNPRSKSGRCPRYFLSLAAFTTHLTAIPTPDCGHNATGTWYFDDFESLGRT